MSVAHPPPNTQGEEDSGSKVTPQEAEMILREKFDEESHWLTEVQVGKQKKEFSTQSVCLSPSTSYSYGDSPSFP